MGGESGDDEEEEEDDEEVEIENVSLSNISQSEAPQTSQIEVRVIAELFSLYTTSMSYRDEHKGWATYTVAT